MFKCPQCHEPLDLIDDQGLDCLICKKFYPNHIILQWEQDQIAINEAESFAEWHSEQFHSVGGVI